ncbi:MAG: GvpL/GvpF family gas vesicle protein [Roseiflexaceae bacterium]|nr:GvpL/GvpF family gas vesicle protein [Roseiflexaceae bacterium]
MTAGTYVYCIMRSAEPRIFTTAGIGGRGDAVYTVHYDDLAAVVSDSPEQEYEHTRRHMLCHAAVLDEVMRAAPILPVRFGTIASSPEKIKRNVLTPRYKELDTLLHQFEDRIELGLKVLWREDQVMQEIVASSAPIRELHTKVSSRPAAETYYARIQLGQLVEAEMQRRRAADAEYILEHLRPLAKETRQNAAITERMVLNVAFLIERAAESAFDAIIQQLDAEMGQRMIFKYVGNVPPYNFVNVTI